MIALVEFQAMGLAQGLPAPTLTDRIRTNLPACTASIDHARADLSSATDFSTDVIIRGLESILADAHQPHAG